MPLDIQLDDVKLSQISGWKVASTGTTANGQSGQCRLRYQQSSFEVRFRLPFRLFGVLDHVYEPVMI